MRKHVYTALTALGAAALTAAVLLYVYYTCGQYPFGDKSISWCDMTQQAVPLLCDFKDILSGNGNILLNMQNAGGMNFWGVFFFFAASPFSFLVAFVEKGEMLSFVSILVLLKAALAAFTASLLFKKCFDRLPIAANLALSLSYALCGYTLMFYQNVIWLDLLWCFPLVLLSLKRLSDTHRPYFFIVTLSLFMVMNYYIGYMLVVYLLLGVPLWIIMCKSKDERGKLSLLFIVSCFIAALMTAVVWLPSLLQYTDSARGTDLISSLASGNLWGYYTTKSLLLMCTPVMFAAIPFMRGDFKSEGGRRRVWIAVMFALTLIASVFEPINKMWHTGNYMSFPLRYGFILALCGLLAAASVINGHEGAGSRFGSPFAVIGGIGAVAAVYGASKLLKDDYYSDITVFSRTLWGNDKSYGLLALWCLIAIFAFALLFGLTQSKQLNKRLACVLICVCTTVGCVFNTDVYIGSVQTDDSTYRAAADLENRIDDPSFYRVKTQKKYFVVNQIGSLGYNSLAHYTSLTNSDYMFAMKKLGYSSYWMEVNSNGGTLLTDAILRNNYTVSRDRSFAFSNDTVYDNGTFRLIKSAFTFPAAAVLSADPTEHANLPEMERSELQQYLYKLYGGVGELVKRYDFTSAAGVGVTHSDGLYYISIKPDQVTGSIYYTIEVNGRQALYFDAFKDISNRLKEALNESFSVAVNNVTVQSSYPDQGSNGLLYLGDFENETVTVRISVKKNAVAASFGVFSVDCDKLAALEASVDGCDIKVNGSRVYANVESTDGGYLYICLPYIDGYKATVNGRSVTVYPVNDAFIALPLESGKNEIVMSYLPSGFSAGAVMSVVGFIMLALLAAASVFLKPKLPQRALNIAKTVSLYLLAAAFALVFAAVYIFPMFVFFMNQ